MKWINIQWWACLEGKVKPQQKTKQQQQQNAILLSRNALMRRGEEYNRSHLKAMLAALYHTTEVAPISLSVSWKVKVIKDLWHILALSAAFPTPWSYITVHTSHHPTKPTAVCTQMELGCFAENEELWDEIGCTNGDEQTVNNDWSPCKFSIPVLCYHGH